MTTTPTPAAVEKVARAMQAVSRPDVNPDQLTPGPRGSVGLAPVWLSYEHMARAAIAAMQPADDGWADVAKRLRDRLAMATPGPWMVQDGCSWRRIGTHFHDGDVLCPTNSRRDNHPDLIAGEGKLYANLMLIVEAVNALPALLDAVAPPVEQPS